MSSISGGDAAKIILAVGAVAAGGYFIYKLANPGSTGGSCTDPSTPCGAAIQPLQAELQSCLDNFTALNTQIAQSGLAPTAGQQAALNSYTTCMQSVGSQIASTASGFVGPSLAQEAFEAVMVVGVTAAIGKYGLPGLGDALAAYRRSGLVTTAVSDAGSASSVIENASVADAYESGLITDATASEWAGVVQGVADNSAAVIASTYNELAAEGYITNDVAQQYITDLSESVAADADSVISFIEQGGVGYAPLARGCLTCAGA